MESLSQEVTACVLRIHEVEIGYVIDQPAIGLFWNILIETPVSGLHVIDGNVHTLSHYGGERAIRVAQNQERVRLLPLKDLLGLS